MAFPFVFERSKLVPVTKHDSINVLVDSKSTISSNKPSIEMMENALHNRVPVSTSGRTLAEILSLSDSDNLKLYSINRIKLVWGKTMVGYSRREPSMMVCIFELFVYEVLSPYLCFNLGFTTGNKGAEGGNEGAEGGKCGAEV